MRPELEVLCMSGHTDEAALRPGVIDSGLALLTRWGRLFEGPALGHAPGR